MQDFRDLPPKLRDNDQATYPVPKEVTDIRPFIEQALEIANKREKPIVLVHHGMGKESEIAVSISPGSTKEKIHERYNEQASKLGRLKILSGAGVGEINTKSPEKGLSTTIC